MFASLVSFCVASGDDTDVAIADRLENKKSSFFFFYIQSINIFTICTWRGLW